MYSRFYMQDVYGYHSFAVAPSAIRINQFSPFKPFKLKHQAIKRYPSASSLIRPNYAKLAGFDGVELWVSEGVSNDINLLLKRNK